MRPQSAVVRPKASREDILVYRAAIRRLAEDLWLRASGVRRDGTLVVHSSEEGYLSAARLSALASSLIGRDVHVITDDVPGAAGAQEL